MKDGMHKVWKFKNYFLACAFYSVTGTFMMFAPLVGLLFCWPAVLAGMIWIQPLLNKAGISFSLDDEIMSSYPRFSTDMLLTLSMYSLVLFLPMAINVIRPRKYWIQLQAAIILAHPILAPFVAWWYLGDLNYH